MRYGVSGYLLIIYIVMRSRKGKHMAAWYQDAKRLTYIATYKKDKDAQKEMEAAAQHGWTPQGTTATDGHINVGRTMTKLVLTGGLGLMTGASRSKGKITITFVRTPEWLAQRQ